MENFDVIVSSSGGGKKFPLLQPDSYPALCYAIIDIGRHYSPVFDKSSDKVILMWELPTERIDVERDGQTENLPRAISETYTLSLSEKANLRKTLESWRGKSFTEEELKGFNLRNILGAPCLLTVVNQQKQNGDAFNKVSAVVKLPAMMRSLVPQATENPPIMFSLKNPNAVEMMKTLPEWIQNRIKESETWKEMCVENAGLDAGNEFVEVSEEDIPF